ncbi:MAG: hypothetical protein ACLSHX_10800 [Suilimivivens sp.]
MKDTGLSPISTPVRPQKKPMRGLTGERISQQNYKKKAEENMVNMIREKEENKQKYY